MCPPPPPAKQSSGVPTVLLGLHDQLLASTLAESLAKSCRVVGVATTWNEFHDALEELNPSLALVDILIGADRVMPELGRAVAQSPSTRFILCTPDLGDVMVERALVAVVAGVLGHDCTTAQLVAVLRATVDGTAWPTDLGKPAVSHAARPRPLEPLTVREWSVFELLWQGRTHKEIAVIIDRSVKTVEAIVSRIRKAYSLKRNQVAPWETIRRGRPSDAN